MGAPLPIATFGDNCLACNDTPGTTPDRMEVIFCGVEFCPPGGLGNCQVKPVWWPSLILDQNPAIGKECQYIKQTAPGFPYWSCQYHSFDTLPPDPESWLFLSYVWNFPPPGSSDYFWSGNDLDPCKKLFDNLFDVADCVAGLPECGYDGKAVVIPYPDPYPRIIVESLGWTDFDNWLYERNFDENCWPVYRLHHSFPWHTFTVKFDPDPLYP